MDELIRAWDNLTGRLHGPFAFRLILQPVMAIFFAFRDGRRDALQGRVPYFWAIFTTPGHRTELLHEGWKAVARVFILAVGIDVAYQLVVFHRLYPVEALIVAFFLAFFPYLVIRGPVNRVVRRRMDS